MKTARKSRRKTHDTSARKGDEVYVFMTLQFNVTRAYELLANRAPVLIEPRPSPMTRIDEAFAMSDACDPAKPGILVILPGDLGSLRIDGNHRAYKAARLGIAQIPTHVVADAADVAQFCMSAAMWAKMEREG